MQVQDDLYLGDGNAIGTLGKTTSANPTLNQGVGQAGRIFFHNMVPLAALTNNIATSQHMTSATGLTLTAGTGITAGSAPDGSGSTVYQTDTPRCISLSSTSNLSAINFTLTGYDMYGQKLTSTIAGPNNNTVTFPKSVASVLSIVPNTTDGTHNVTAGTTDVFGLPFAVADGGYVMPRWGGALAFDPGTLTLADATSPATASTGDVRGTYQPSSASNGARRLVVWMHLTQSQCGWNSTRSGAIGVPQA